MVYDIENAYLALSSRVLQKNSDISKIMVHYFPGFPTLSQILDLEKVSPRRPTAPSQVLST